MSAKITLRLLLGLMLVAGWALADEAGPHGAVDPQKLGSVQFPNSCSPAVQRQFTQAVAMLHSFGYEEARRQFTAVTEADPGCAIAWWGMAMTYWQPLWELRGPNPDPFRKGQEAIAKARAASSGASQRERLLIAALGIFYGDPEKADHTQRILGYEKAMRNVYLRYADDTEARVFYALAMVGNALSLAPDKTYARQRAARDLLLPVFRAHPDHPGVAHYIIHASDYPALAADGLEAARRYAQIAPDSPHAQHMPSHIFTRLGLWQESIESNRRVIEVARQHHAVGEELHAADYLVFAYLQQGQDRQAQAVMAAMPKVDTGEALRFGSVYARAAVPVRYAVERRQWSEAVTLQVPADFPGGRYAWADAAIYFARALGAARTGSLQQARADVGKLAACHETLTQLKEDYWAGQVEIQRQSAAAWLALAEGRKDEALELMRSAAALEDATDKHPVTPGQIVPARDLLGQMLLELNRPQEAGAEFARVIESEPNRFGALYGAARAAELAGETGRARELYATLVKLAPASDRAELRHARAAIAG